MVMRKLTFSNISVITEDIYLTHSRGMVGWCDGAG